MTKVELISALPLVEAVKLCEEQLQAYQAATALPTLDKNNKVVPLSQYHENRLLGLKQVLFTRHHLLNEAEKHLHAITQEINAIKGHARQEKLLKKALIEQKAEICDKLCALRADNEINHLNLFLLEQQPIEKNQQVAIINAILNFQPYTSFIEKPAAYFKTYFIDRLEKSSVAHRHRLPKAVFVSPGDRCKLLDEEAILLTSSLKLADINIACQALDNLLTSSLHSVVDLCLLDDRLQAIDASVRECRKMRTTFSGMIHREELAVADALADPLLAQRVAAFVKQLAMVQVSLQQTLNRVIRCKTQLQHRYSQVHAKIYQRYKKNKDVFFNELEQEIGLEHFSTRHMLFYLRAFEALEKTHVERSEHQYEYIARVLQHIGDAALTNVKLIKKLLAPHAPVSAALQSIAFRLCELCIARKELSAAWIEGMQRALQFHTQKINSDLSSIILSGEILQQMEKKAEAKTVLLKLDRSALINHAEVLTTQMNEVALFYQQYCSASVYYSIKLDDTSQLNAQVADAIAQEVELLAMLQNSLAHFQKETAAICDRAAYYQAWQAVLAAHPVHSLAAAAPEKQAIAAAVQNCDDRLLHLETHYANVAQAHEQCQHLANCHRLLQEELSYLQ